MGGAKQRFDEELYRGFSSTDTFICPTCAGDEALAGVVADDADPNEDCSYCGQPPAASLDGMIGHMLQAIRLEYRPASEESPPWDGREGGYRAPELYLPELLFEELQADFGSPKVDEDISEALAPHYEPWFEKYWYALRPHEQFLASWQRFARLTVRRRDGELRPLSRQSNDPDDPIGTDEVLDELASLIADLPEAYRTLPRGTTLWRARYGSPAGHRTASTLGPPPPSATAPAGRMNRLGQTWFYGSLERETSVVEKFRSKANDHLSIGPFVTTRALTLLDLTGEGLVEPSIYDLERQHVRPAVRFLRAFAVEISLPVIRTNSPRYAPTQLVTEYVRTELDATTGVVADGILFPSSRTVGTNVVLFAGSEACVDRGAPARPRTLLRLDSRLVNVLRPAAVRRVWIATR